MFIGLGFASVGNHIPQGDSFNYRPLRNVILIYYYTSCDFPVQSPIGLKVTCIVEGARTVHFQFLTSILPPSQEYIYIWESIMGVRVR